jgi:hypothetical protein
VGWASCPSLMISGQDARTTKGYSSVANIATEAIDFPLKHPPFMMANIQADKYTQENQLSPSLLNRIKKKLISNFQLILNRRYSSYNLD